MHSTDSEVFLWLLAQGSTPKGIALLVLFFGLMWFFADRRRRIQNRRSERQRIE
jgi:hypothetical protein